MKRVLKRGAIALLAVLGLLVVYGVLVEPRLILDVDRFEVTLPQLPDGADGTTVAVFSDLQIGMWFANPGMIERVVAEVVEEGPAAAFVVGDFVYSRDPDPAAQVDRVVELLAPLPAAGIPTFAVLGNHDYLVGAAEDLATALEGNGIRVLRNDAVLVPASGAGPTAVYVVGLDARHPGRTDTDAALAEVPVGAPRVVMMHNPASFRALPPDSAPLAVAGHTHCGQIAIPFTPVWSYVQLRADERVVVDGWAPAGYGAKGNRLHVNCGIGFSLVPMRATVPPQVVFFELRAA